MYGLSNCETIFDLGSPLKVKGEDQTLKTLKSNISKTVRDREKVSMEVRLEVLYGLSTGENIFDFQVTPKNQRSNAQNFEVEYLENGTR